MPPRRRLDPLNPSDGNEPGLWARSWRVPGHTYRDISKMIDHSLPNPALTAAEHEAGCRLALQYDVASVCSLPF